MAWPTGWASKVTSNLEQESLRGKEGQLHGGNRHGGPSNPEDGWIFSPRQLGNWQRRPGPSERVILFTCGKSRCQVLNLSRWESDNEQVLR